MASALRNAAKDRIVNSGKAKILEYRCRAYASRISAFWYWENVPLGYRAARALSSVRQRRMFPRAYRLIETSLDFLQEAINDHAARFATDISLESRIAAMAALLNLPNPAADDI